jgi:DNA-binding NarL/FixJ family response regulator
VNLMATRITVALLNDYDVVVAGLAAMLERYRSEVKVVDASVSRPTRRTPIDVVLYDTFGRANFDMDRLALTIEQPNVHHVAVYSFDFRPAVVETAIRRGARGYLWKGMSSASLVHALRRIADGEVVISEARSTNDPLRMPEADWPGKKEGLTAKESEAVILLAQGLRNREIGGAMHASPDTVKTHLRHAYRKLGVRNRAQAAALVVSDLRFAQRERRFD